jgi:hypothetical protein
MWDENCFFLRTYMRSIYEQLGGTRSWLRYYATNRRVAGSVPYEVIAFSNLPNPSSRIMALGSTQPLTEMSTRHLPVGKGRPARKTGNLTAHLWADCLESASLDVSEPHGRPRPVTGIAFRLYVGGKMDLYRFSRIYTF